MRDSSDGKLARAEMDAAKAQSEKTFSGYKGPKRYKIYDRIKDHVSLRTVDIVIAVTALLIVALLVYGILTATPPQ